ncbi:MAG TPA: hypothetical protein VMZ28_01125 [Kofleriaceae bacterium]|nr:hypothetical protein [Kofleriaceae bacterium]
MSMDTDRPIFRTDLVAKPIDGGNGSDRLVEVTDPDSGKSFRFYEIEYAIACAMDGERDLPGLAQWANIELGLEPGEAELRTMIGTLGELGYLEGVAGAQPAAPGAKAGSVTRGWDAVEVPDELLNPPAAAAAPAKGAVTRGWDAVEMPDDLVAAAKAPAAPAAAAKQPAKSGSVTRGWDAVDGDAIAAASAPPAAAAKPAASSKQPAPMAAKAPTKVTPPAAPAAGGVTRGWDVQSDDIDLGAPGKAATPPAAGGVSRGRELPSDDVELGFAGRQSRPAAPASNASMDVELGQAGNVGLSDPDAIEADIHDRATKQRPSAPGGGDFSTDLSEHIAVRTDDVKEAVRASRVHAAVKAPEDYVDDEGATAVGGSAAHPAAAAAAAEVAQPKSAVVVKKTMIAASVPPAVTAAAQAKKAADQKAASEQPKASAQQGRKASGPVVLPEKPAEVSRPVAAAQHAHQPQNQQQQSAATAHLPQQQGKQAARKSALLPILLIILFLALAGAGVYWWIEMRGGDEPASQPAPEKPQPTAEVEKPAKPAEPPAITAALEAGPSEERQALAPRPGQIAWLAAAGSEVAEGAPVAKYYGFETWEKAISTSQESLKVYQEKLDQATSKDDKPGMKSADANVKRKQKDLERAQTELQRFVVAAPLAGVVEPIVEAKARVQKDAPVAKVLATSGPRATFTVPPDRKAAAGDEVQVSSKADADLRATCKVESADAGKLVVTCPTDSGLAPGTDVVLK